MSIQSSIRAGIAVGTLAKSAIEASMKVLGAQQGFPVLPATSLVLLKRPNANSEVIREMEQAIRVQWAFWGKQFIKCAGKLFPKSLA